MIRQLFPPSIIVSLVLCLFVYALTSGAHFSSTDEEDLYLNTTLLAAQLEYRLSFPTRSSADKSINHRAPQEIGQSLAAIPWYWVGQWLSKVFSGGWQTYIQRAVMTTFNGFVTLVTIWVLFLWGRQITTAYSAVFTAFAYGLATFAWPYSQTFYREPLVGLCLLLSFWYASQFSITKQRYHFLISVAALMFAVATKVVVLVALPWWFICWGAIWFRLHRPKMAYLIIAVSGVILAFIFSISAKSETVSHYLQEFQYDLENNPLTVFWYGLTGLLVSPGKGLLLFAPPSLLAFFGFSKFAKQNRPTSIAIGGLFLTFLLMYSTRRGWHGGACWGPRYLLPMLPLLMLPAGVFVAEYIDRTKEKRTTYTKFVAACIVGIVIFGITVQIAAVSIFPLNYFEMKIAEGVVSKDSLEGGPKYLQEIFFNPIHSPIWGHSLLTIQRIKHLFQSDENEQMGVFPTDPHELWKYMISLSTLDFWWLHWLMQPSSAVEANDRIGVVLAPPTQSWLTVAYNGGIKFNRWQINWRDIEAVPGNYDFSETDRQLAIIKAAGMEVTILLTYPPDWARQPGTLVPAELLTEAEPTAWVQFVKAIVERYPNIHYWEIWNEPDMDMYWGGTAEEYVKLLRASYLTIKKVNPEAKVIMAGLAYWPNRSFFETVLDLILADPLAQQNNYYFDISAWHWYGRSSDLYDKVNWARTTMKQRGIDKPIWVNETNVALTPQKHVDYSEIQWTATANEQAAFIVQAYANALAAGAEKVFVFRLDDANMPTTWGLLTNDQIPRPSYTALQAVAEFLDETKAKKRTTQAGITKVVFEKIDGGEVWVVWNELPVSQQFTFQPSTSTVQIGYPDRKIQSLQTENGSVTVELPPATANYGNDSQDYFVGGMPLFVFR